MAGNLPLSSQVAKNGVQSMKSMSSADRNIGEAPRAEKARHRRPIIAGPIELQRIGPRVDERQAMLGLLAAGMRRGNAGIFGAHLGDGARPRLAREQRGNHADGAACVIDIDGLAAPVVGMDLDRGVHAARGRAADQ